MKEIDPARSKTMRAVRSKNTGPECAVRRMAHSLGFRFRLHRKDLPGTPDLVFPKYYAVIFVHGCFWHGHNCPRGSRTPKANAEYWRRKLERNKMRDAKALSDLLSAGWRVQTIWECELKDCERLKSAIVSFLSGKNDPQQESVTLVTKSLGEAASAGRCAGQVF